MNSSVVAILRLSAIYKVSRVRLPNFELLVINRSIQNQSYYCKDYLVCLLWKDALCLFTDMSKCEQVLNSNDLCVKPANVERS